MPIKYHAHFIQTGTNERLTLTADSPEALETMIYGLACGPKFNSVTYWSTHPEEE
jgi:hypothetical protein